MLAVKLLSSSCSQMKHACSSETKMPGEKFMTSKQNLGVEDLAVCKEHRAKPVKGCSKVSQPEGAKVFFKSPQEPLRHLKVGRQYWKHLSAGSWRWSSCVFFHTNVLALREPGISCAPRVFVTLPSFSFSRNYPEFVASHLCHIFSQSLVTLPAYGILIT